MSQSFPRKKTSSKISGTQLSIQQQPATRPQTIDQMMMMMQQQQLTDAKCTIC